MADETDDLRDRFRRSDYKSALIRTQAAAPNRNNTLPPQPSEPSPTTSPSAPTPIMAPVPRPVSPPSPEPRMQPSSQVEVNRSSSRKPQPPASNPRPSVPPTFQIRQNESTPRNQPIESEPTPYAPKKSHRQKRAEKKSSKSSSKKAKWIVIIPLLLFVLAGAGLGVIQYLKTRQQKPEILFPAQYTSASLGFSLYYPKNMPAGYRIAPTSFTYKDGVLIFSINSSDGKLVPVSEQTIPDGSSAGQLIPAPTGVKVTEVENIDFPDGKSAISKWDNKTLTSTVADKTWIILNVSNISKEDAKALTQAFEKLNY